MATHAHGAAAGAPGGSEGCGDEPWRRGPVASRGGGARWRATTVAVGREILGRLPPCRRSGSGDFSCVFLLFLICWSRSRVVHDFWMICRWVVDVVDFVNVFVLMWMNLWWPEILLVLWMNLWDFACALCEWILITCKQIRKRKRTKKNFSPRWDQQPGLKLNFQSRGAAIFDPGWSYQPHHLVSAISPGSRIRPPFRTGGKDAFPSSENAFL